MSRQIKNIIQSVADPTALIIGEGALADKLATTVGQNGCSVTRQQSYSPSFIKYDYIFLFDELHLIEKILDRHTSQNSKFIFIDTKHLGKVSSFTARPVAVYKPGDRFIMENEIEKILHLLFNSASPIVSVPVQNNDHIPLRQKIPSPQVPDVNSPAASALKKFSSAQKFISKPPFYKKHRKKIFGLFFLSLIAGFTISSYLYFASLSTTLSNIRTHSASGDLALLSVDLAHSRTQLEVVNRLSAALLSLPVLNSLDQTRQLAEVLKNINNILDAGGQSLTFLQKLPLFSKDTLTRAEMENFKAQLDTLAISLASVRQNLAEISLPGFDKEYYLAIINAQLEKLVSIRSTLPILEEIALSENVGTYLVLFQNSMELRPTGGFIGSLGLLTIGGGRIYDFSVMDVYTADGQLKGHVEPPGPIRKYLNQPNFFLRDSNFDPDFAASAVQAAWFLDKELGIKADGVIGVNLYLAQDLLRVMGPVTLSDFGSEVVWADNFFLKAQTAAQKDFFPGSSQKKDYLKSIAAALELKLTAPGRKPWLALFETLKKNLEQKNLLLFSTKDSVQKKFESEGWAGRMAEGRCVAMAKTATPLLATNSKCLFDYLSINEANLGVNKANYFVSKTLSIDKKITATSAITTTLTLSYENKSITGLIEAGAYLNYLRILVPLQSKLDFWNLNGVNIEPKNIDLVDSADKTSFGTLVRIAPDNKAKVTISYTLPYPLTDFDSYQFYFQKQGGDKVSPLVLSYSLPQTLTLQPVNFSSYGGLDNGIYYTTDTSVDRIFAFSLKK